MAADLKVSLRIIYRNRVSLVSFIIVSAFILMAAVGPELLPYDATPRVRDRYLPPSWRHPLGTDYAGRDTFTQIVHGSREVLIVAFLTAIISVFISFTIGIISGFIRGKVDALLMMAADIFLIIPSFPLLLIIVSLIPRALTTLEIAFILSIVGWAPLSRAIRSRVLSLKEETFIESARCLGLSRRHIIFNEILPNLYPFITTMLILSIVQAVYSQVGLYFIGALPFTSTNWGVMIQIALGHGALINPRVWPYLLSPLLCLILIQTGFILLLHSLEEVFNPRLRAEA